MLVNINSMINGLKKNNKTIKTFGPKNKQKVAASPR
jgi:hypothetical protein